jgi:hypothetical protein
MLLAHLISGRYSKTGADEPYTTVPKGHGWLARLMALFRRS